MHSVCLCNHNPSHIHTHIDTWIAVELNEDDKRVEDAEQIQKDVVRTLGKWTRAGPERTARQAALQRVLLRAFAQNRGAKHYFQGCNDVAAVLLLALGEVQAARALVWLMNHTLARWFEPALPPLVELMEQLMPLVHLADPACHAQLCAADCTAPDYALSWVMTWFAHITDDLGAVYALYDVLFAVRGAVATPVVYLAAQTVLLCADALVRLPCDLPAVYQYFACKMPLLVTAAHARAHGRSGASCPVCALVDRNLYGSSSNNSRRDARGVIVVEQLIAGAQQLQERWDWAALQQHKAELARDAAKKARDCDCKAQEKLKTAMQRARGVASASSSMNSSRAIVLMVFAAAVGFAAYTMKQALN